jgi:hypothetical protein
VIDPIATGAAQPTPATGTSTSSTSQTSDANKAFEQMLVQQLTQEMIKTIGDAGSSDDSDDSDDGDTGSSALGGPYASMLPGIMADAIEGSGGLGLDFGLDSTSTGSTTS